MADVLQPVGCMNQGKTLDEALNNIKDAIRGRLEAERKHGASDIIEEREVFPEEMTIWVGILSANFR